MEGVLSCSTLFFSYSIKYNKVFEAIIFKYPALGKTKKIATKYHRDLDHSVFVSLSREFLLCTVLSHMLGHVTSSTNGKLYTIKINKDFLMKLLKAVI